jgi:hypothetical protein
VKLQRKCKACGAELTVRFDGLSWGHRGWKFAIQSWWRWRKYHTTMNL